MSGTGQVQSLPISLAKSLPKGLARQGGGTPPFTLSGSLPNGTQADNYLGVLSISGGVAPYSNPQVVAGSLPADFTLTIVGNQLHVTATAPLAFSGVVSCSLTVQDAALHTTPPLPVTFTIASANFIMTEDGKYLTTEDGKFLVTE